MSAIADHIGTYLARAVGGVLEWPKLTIVTMLAASAGALWYAAVNLGVNTDTANMISASLPWRQDFNEYRSAYPSRDRNLLIVIDAPTSARAGEFAAELLAELRREPERYRSIVMQGEGEFFARNGLLYLSLRQVEDLSDRLTAAQPLLGLLRARFDGAAVLDVATRTLEPTVSGSAADAAVLAPFYRELAHVLEDVRAGSPAPLEWGALLAAGAPESTRRIVALQPALDFGRMQPAADAIAGIREIARRLNSGAAEPVSVRLSGSVAMEHEELSSVSRGAGLAGLATLFMVAIVLYASLRSWRLLAFSVISLFAGLSFTAAFAAAAVGHLNLLSIAFVVLNVGLGSDYVIHVLLRHRELVAEDMRARPALVETMRGVGSSLVLCAVTTAAGFYSFIPTKFEGVSELGLIAGTGVFFGLLVSVTLLPALVLQFASNLQVADPRALIDAKIFVPFSRHPRAVLAATAAIIVASIASLPALSFDSNPIHLRDPRSESVTTLLELAAGGEAQILNLVAVAPDHATALGWAERLRALPEVRSVTTVESLVPKDQAEKIAVLEDLDLILGAGFADLARAAANPGRLAASLAALESESRGRSDMRDLHTAAAGLAADLSSAPPADRERRLGALDDALTADLPAELRRLAEGLTARPFGRDALPAPIAERWLAADGRELVEIVPREDVSDNGAASRFIAAVHSIVPRATGLPVVYQEASRTIVHAFALAMLYALVMVSVIIWIVLRDSVDTLLVMVPIVLAALVTAGLTVLIDVPLNYANIIALPLLVGIGVDNGIHVVHRMRTESAEQLFDTSTMRAVLASALTTIASFGNLAFSSHVGTASMGILLALGLSVSMASTLIALPAWLKLRSSNRRAGYA
jgi:hopanoid biosynthesis associated RND transporter like protein HpnN